MNAQRQTALTATPMTMEERRASFAKLIAETADPKRKEALAQILEQIEKHPEPSPALLADPASPLAARPRLPASPRR